MAQRDFRIDLHNSLFPMLSEQMGRTIIGSVREEQYAKGNTPQVYYCHNVMPSAYGLDSVGYQSQIPAVVPAGNSLIDVRVIYSSTKRRLHLAWTTYGEVYATREGATGWAKLPDTVPSTVTFRFEPDEVTVGNVNGISYIFYAGIGCFVYNDTTNELDPVTLTGLTIADVLGITATSGYLIAYTTEAIAWSSTIEPTDFAPSQVTGAGGGNVANIGGAIIFCLANDLGVLIYTATNTVAATYTGNLRYPFKFREVKNSKGGISLDLVAYEANSASHFVYSKAGLQAVTSQKADNLLPEVTDFLAGKRFEDFDEATATFDITDLTTTMLKKVKFIASRYLVISYGIATFTHALVYDVTLEKLGKLKISHTDCFEYINDQVEVSKESIAFLNYDGSVQLLDFATSAISSGVCILGKLQFTRNRMITLQEVESENIETDATCAVSTLYSLDGKNQSKADGYAALSANNIRVHNFHTTALNHSLLYVGKFNLTSVLIKYTAGGKR